jgi:hypothetical protein
MGHAMSLLFYGAMSATERARAAASSWYKPPDRIRSNAAARVRKDEQRTKKTRSIIVLSIFLAFLVPALFIGCRAFIGPMLRTNAEERQANRIGEVVFTMPDGAFCRRLSFDNKTAEVNESTVDHCPEARPRGKEKEADTSRKGFAWGNEQ